MQATRARGGCWAALQLLQPRLYACCTLLALLAAAATAPHTASAARGRLLQVHIDSGGLGIAASVILVVLLLLGSACSSGEGAGEL